MIRYILLAAFVWMVTAPDLAAQSRAEQMQRVVDGLNAANPVTRVVTFEEAMATRDKAIRKLAISTALGSSDLDLRGYALAASFETKETLAMSLTGPANERTRPHLIEKSGGTIIINILDFNPADGSFRATSNYTLYPHQETKQLPGTVSGDRVSFEINIHELAGSAKCLVTAQLDASGSLLKGLADCETRHSLYTIEIDLLR